MGGGRRYALAGYKREATSGWAWPQAGGHGRAPLRRNKSSYANLVFILNGQDLEALLEMNTHIPRDVSLFGQELLAEVEAVRREARESKRQAAKAVPTTVIFDELQSFLFNQ